MNIKFSFFISILILLFIKINSYETSKFHFIISGALNGTAAIASFNQVPANEDYLYFTFDFDFHSKVSKDPNIAYFVINSRIDYSEKISSNEKVEYGFLEKTWTEVNSLQDLKNVKKWKKIEFLFSHNSPYSFNNYCQAERIIDKMNTLILRVPTYGIREGRIMISNILDLPDDKE